MNDFVTFKYFKQYLDIKVEMSEIHSSSRKEIVWLFGYMSHICVIKIYVQSH